MSKPQVEVAAIDDQEAASFKGKLRTFNNKTLEQVVVPDSSTKPQPAPQKLLSAEQRSLLYDMLFAVSRERDYQPDIQHTEKDNTVEGIPSNTNTQKNSKSKSIEEVARTIEADETLQQHDSQDGKEKFDIQSSVIAELFHNSLHHSTMPLDEVVYNMRNMLHTVKSAGRYSEDCAWALINKACSDAGLNFAFDTANRRDLNNVGLQVYALYRAHAQSASDPQSLASSIRSELPALLTQNNIRYVYTGNSPLTMEDGIIAVNNRVPEHFSSKLGYGSTMDSLIRNAAAYVGKIAERASLSHIVEIDRKDLLRLTSAAAQIKAKHGTYNERYFDSNDPSPIPQEDGRLLLNHINNMLCLKNAAVVAPMVHDKDLENTTKNIATSESKSSQEVSSTTIKQKPTVTRTPNPTPSEMLQKVARIAAEMRDAFVPEEGTKGKNGDISPQETYKETNMEYGKVEGPEQTNSKLLKQLEQKLKRCVDMEGVKYSEGKGSVAGNFGAKISETVHKTGGEGHSR